MNTIIVHPKNANELNTIATILSALKVTFELPKGKSISEVEYSTELLTLIEKGKDDIKNGNLKTIKTEDLWK
jgi:hypothetical protein